MRIHPSVVREMVYIHLKQDRIFRMIDTPSQFTYATAPRNLIIIVDSISSTAKLSC